MVRDHGIIAGRSEHFKFVQLYPWAGIVESRPLAHHEKICQHASAANPIIHDVQVGEIK
jgi:hypothetical protein